MHPPDLRDRVTADRIHVAGTKHTVDHDQPTDTGDIMLTKQQLVDQTFESVDSDGDGYITEADLVDSLTRLGKNVAGKTTSGGGGLLKSAAGAVDTLTSAATELPKVAAQQWQRISS